MLNFIATDLQLYKSTRYSRLRESYFWGRDIVDAMEMKIRHTNNVVTEIC